MEILKGKITRIQQNGDMSVELWSGGKPIMVTRVLEPHALSKTHMNHDSRNFQKNALTRNALLHKRN